MESQNFSPEKLPTPDISPQPESEDTGKLIVDALKYEEIVLDENNKTYIEKGYVYDTSGAKKLLHYQKSIIDTKLLGDSIKNLPKLQPDVDKGYDVVLHYNKLDTSAYFIARIKINDDTYYRKIDQKVCIDGVAISDDNGKLIGNLVVESTINGIIVCNYSIEVVSHDENNASENNKMIQKFLVLDGTNTSEDLNKLGIVATEVNIFKALPETPVICTVKTDVHIIGGRIQGKSTDMVFVLDGGNLYRQHKICAVPNKIVCKNGTYIDVPSKGQFERSDSLPGANGTYLKDPKIGTSLKLFGGQNNITMDFNPMDFVLNTDYTSVNNQKSINLNNVLDRIFASIYNRNGQSQRMVIKMPETVYGNTTFYLVRPVVIPHNVTLDMSGSTVFISEKFVNVIREKNANGLDILDENWNPGQYNRAVDYIFAFGTNSVYPILATSVVKNLTIEFHKNYGKQASDPRKVFDLTNFSGVMENVVVKLGGRTDMIAFWQPFGTPRVTYSDQKIIRRCKVSQPGWRNETPTAIFCRGDGCIIDQCLLGYVAIIGGNGYTIRGCLNDSYFLFDTTVDFSGSYWEVGQFQILDSKVTFSNCRLNAQNNHFELSHDENLRRYIGPWMAIDTEGCRQRLINMFKKHSLNLVNFNQIKYPLTYNGLFLGRATSQFSTVEFKPTINTCQEYWGYKQPMSSPLIMTGGMAKIVGMENLESMDEIYIHNWIPNQGTVPESVNVTISQPSYVPLVNGNFADVKSDVKVPDKVVIKANLSGEFDVKYSDLLNKLGVDWTGEKINSIRARFVLDPARRLYSKEYTCDTNIATEANRFVVVSLFVDMSTDSYSNLKTELLLNVVKNGATKRYIFRQHFNRVVNGDLFCFGNNGCITDNIKSVISKNQMIGKFDIAKAYFNKSAIESQEQVESVECTADLPTPSVDALCDYWGNMYEPSQTAFEIVNTATRIQWITDTTLRAYMSKLPIVGTWNDGDEVVLPSAVYRFFNGKWYKVLTFTSSSLQPIEPIE